MADDHDFSALWWNLGQFGRQDIHLHACATDSHGNCKTELVGDGAACGGKGTPHYELRLIIGSAWAKKEDEGKPLSQYERALPRSFDHDNPRHFAAIAAPDA